MKFDLNGLIAACQEMTPTQRAHLVKGIKQIEVWYIGNYVGVGGHGTLKAAARSKDVTLLATTMHWLAKHFCPESLQFADAYRIHKAEPTNAATATIKPFRPVLSWSDRPKITIVERDAGETTMLLKLKAPKVIWSYLTMRALSSALARTKVASDSAVVQALSRLSIAAVKFDSERELVVWHGKTPFKVAVIKRTAGLAEALASLGLDDLKVKGNSVKQKMPLYAWEKLETKLRALKFTEGSSHGAYSFDRKVQGLKLNVMYHPKSKLLWITAS